MQIHSIEKYLSLGSKGLVSKHSQAMCLQKIIDHRKTNSEHTATHINKKCVMREVQADEEIFSTIDK